MFIKRKKNIITLIDNIKENIVILKETYKLTNIRLNNCISIIEVLINKLKSENNDYNKYIENLNEANIFLKNIDLNNNKIDLSVIDNILENLDTLKEQILFKTETKLNIVFMPYKISMWDSLKSIYESAIKDVNCVAKVVPIPYYEKNDDRKIYKYEGEDFSKQIKIQDYRQFDLSIEEPDIIFIHNVYDDNNTITEIESTFFTKNLKKYTGMLVYVPYYIPSPLVGGENYLYKLSGIDNVDKIILAGEFAKQNATIMGIREEKILTLGTPKLDEIYNKIKSHDSIQEWEDIIKDNKVLLVNTGCMFFNNDTFGKHTFIENMIDLSRLLDGLTVIWRPHPLTSSSIKKYIPSYYPVFKNRCEAIKNNYIGFENIILDETPDYTVALSRADILLSEYGSLLNSFLLTGNPIIFFGHESSELSIIPKNSLYYFFDEEEPWYVFLRKFIEEDYDPLKQNRIRLSEKIYKNTDGTSGKKILERIKKDTIECMYKELQNG